MPLKDIEKFKDIQLTLEESTELLEDLRVETEARGLQFQRHFQCTEREMQAYCSGYFDGQYLKVRSSLHPQSHLLGKILTKEEI